MDATNLQVGTEEAEISANCLAGERFVCADVCVCRIPIVTVVVELGTITLPGRCLTASLLGSQERHLNLDVFRVCHAVGVAERKRSALRRHWLRIETKRPVHSL